MPRIAHAKAPSTASRRRVLRWAAVFGLSSWVPAARTAERESFRIIVHRDNPATQLSREFLTEAFLKRATRWRDDHAISPVDLLASSATRKAFSEAVLRRSVAAVRSYWQQRIFSGRGLPPPELASDEAVLNYVRKNRGAVGYVSADAAISDVKVVEVR